jgi:hypothetical protein
MPWLAIEACNQICQTKIGDFQTLETTHHKIAKTLEIYHLLTFSLTLILVELLSFFY